MAEDKIDELIRQLFDIFPRVQWDAAEALGKIGDIKAVTALVGALDWHGDRYCNVKKEVIGRKFAEVLGEIAEKNPGNPELIRAVPALADAHNGRDSLLRQSAARALVKIGEPAVPALVDTLKNKDWRVRCSAARALEYIGDVKAVPALINALKDEIWHVNDRASEALVKIGEPAVPALIDALKDGNTNMRWRAADALGKIKDARAVPALIDTLKDENTRVRWDVAEALGKFIPSLTDIRLREMGGGFRKLLEKAEGREEKKKLLNLLDEINKRRNGILEPEVKKLKLPKRIKRKKPKRRIWRAVQG